MKIVYDSIKDAVNIVKHDISLAQAEHFNWKTAEFAIDSRKDYGETRVIAVGYIHERLHVMVFTARDRDTVRIISLHKANAREKRKYEEAKTR